MYYRKNPKNSADVNETPKSKLVVLPKRLEKVEITALLDAPNRDAITGLRNRCMLELMYRAGLRVGEVCSLEMRDINLKKREVNVWMGKGGDRVTGYADETQLDIVLQEWLRRRKKETRDRQLGPRNNEYFFCTIAGGPVSTTYMQQMTKRMARRAKIGINVHPHMLRHTFAAEFLENGGRIQDLQILLGHKNISTTQIYMNVRPQDALSAVHRLGRGT